MTSSWPDETARPKPNPRRVRSSVEKAEPEWVTSDTGPTGQVVGLEVAQGADAAAYVHEAHAAGAAQRHPGVDGDPPDLVADAGCVRAAEHDRAARADLRPPAVSCSTSARVADAEQHQVGGLVERVEVGQAGQVRRSRSYAG